MRKKIVIAATIIVLLLLFFEGFLQYRQYRSYRTPVHAGAQTIIKLNADAFIASFLKEYGFNFARKLKSPNSRETDSTGNTGIYIPGNIFVYNLASKLPSTFFFTLPLNNREDFKIFLHTRFGISFTTGGRQNLGTGFNGALTVLCSTEYAAFAYSAQKEEVTFILEDVLNKRNLMAGTDSLMEKLKTDRSHIVCVSKNGMATARFAGRQIILKGVFSIPGNLVIPARTSKRIMDSNSYASFFVNANPPASWFKRSYTIKQYGLETDSLLPYFNGYADIQIGQAVTQMDTAITYGYNDNFEKTETRTVLPVKVPGVDIAVQAATPFLTYLQKQQIVTAGGVFNREVLPLYHVSANQAGQTLYFNTGTMTAASQFVYSPNFMELKIDCQKIQPLLDSTILKKYISGITGINLSGTKNSAAEIRLDGSIDFESGALKTLIDLIKSLQN